MDGLNSNSISTQPNEYEIEPTQNKDKNVQLHECFNFYVSLDSVTVTPPK